jgi:hypothetical protein
MTLSFKARALQILRVAKFMRSRREGAPVNPDNPFVPREYGLGAGNPVDGPTDRAFWIGLRFGYKMRCLNEWLKEWGFLLFVVTTFVCMVLFASSPLAPSPHYRVETNGKEWRYSSRLMFFWWRPSVTTWPTREEAEQVVKRRIAADQPVPDNGPWKAVK